MPKLSRKLLVALKAGARPMYKVAHEAGLHPSTLSKLVSGIEPVRENDERVLRIGKALRLPIKDLFERR
ncbi:MAG: hypothetical protein HYX59_12885 [Elusimicrobia bacterium]|nr:hypothetical protein [Elusimicrobiota bacterium]